MKLRAFPLLCLSLVLLAKSTCPALDLQPLHQPIRVGEDFPSHFYFLDGAKKTGFRVDRDTDVNGSGAETVFRFKNVMIAEARLSKSAVNQSTPFQGAGLPIYNKIALAKVPEGATEIVVEKQVPDAISMNGWNSYQFVMTYNFYGIGYRQSVTFINYNAKEQLILTARARQQDYPGIYNRAYQIMNSFYEIKPELDAHGN